MIDDDRHAHLPWAITAGMTSSRLFRFLDDTGDRLPVDTWSWSASWWDRPGGTPSALTVDSSQAAVGDIEVLIDNAVSAAWTQDRFWSLVGTDPTGEPVIGLAGPLHVAQLGARGRLAAATVRSEVEVSV